MRNLLLFFMLFAIGCNSTSKSRWDIIKTERNAEIKKGIRKDTIFLGFMFGMSPKQVNSKFQQLVSENRIIINSNNNYEYNVPIDYPENTKAHFSSKFLNDSLYSFRLLIEGDSPSSAALIQVKLASLYSKKYSHTLIVPSVINEKEKDYIFILSNQQIEITYPFLNSLQVEYFDYKMENRKNAIEDANKKKKEEKSIKDL